VTTLPPPPPTHQPTHLCTQAPIHMAHAQTLRRTHPQPITPSPNSLSPTTSSTRVSYTVDTLTTVRASDAVVGDADLSTPPPPLLMLPMLLLLANGDNDDNVADVGHPKIFIDLMMFVSASSASSSSSPSTFHRLPRGAHPRCPSEGALWWHCGNEKMRSYEPGVVD
jgi:hypothetical protein